MRMAVLLYFIFDVISRKHLFEYAISGILYDMDKTAFENAKLKVLLKQHDPHGFGTLQEKTLHAVMKLYYEPDLDCHEVPIEGYIADIYTGKRIIEIQNGNLLSSGRS